MSSHAILNNRPWILIYVPLFLKTAFVFAQFQIPEPVINTGAFAITDTIYMAPNGNDSNDGSFSFPVKTFSAAIQKLPYGSPGFNGGNAYGLIMLKQGFYHTISGFQQYTNTWKNGNTYRNVSVEGMGEVIIGGTVDSLATGHLLQLSGDNIFIKNIKLQFSTGIGILLNRDNLLHPRQKNVLIENVHVDSVGSFGMLLRNVDTILVRKCSSRYGARLGNEHLTSPCQWPSGIKFFNCKNTIIHDCEIAFTRGEGLNFQNSTLGKAFKNKLHDNGLNFYNDNSSKLQVHENLIYNTPDFGNQFWRNCPADTNAVWAGGGMLIANEGSCDAGSAPVFDNCSTKCLLPDEFFPNVDSMFVYNNLFQNTGEALGFWQGNTNIIGVNCVSNVFIFNNTFIGALGMTGAGNAGFINVFFPDYNLVANGFYGTLENVRITHNIFTYDTAVYQNLQPVKMTYHLFHPGPADVTFDHNLWVKHHAFLGVNDIVRNDLPATVPLFEKSAAELTPCDENPEFVYSTTKAFSFLNDDFLNHTRNSVTNVGALEYQNFCDTSTTGIYFSEKNSLTVFPNPCFACENIFVKNLSAENFNYKILSVTGNILAEGKVKDNAIIATSFLNGIYFLVLENEQKKFLQKVIVHRYQ